ncbi:MAG TPA: energy transducer TonB [Gemmatimonadales bacterium]|nr:energy transducer TonB [Gemmatimonadales bacterium]
MRRVAWGIGTLVVLSLGACASGRTDPRRLFLAPWRPPPGQKCFVSKKPFPAVDLLFDTTALGRAVARFGSGSAVAALAFWPADTAWHEEFGPRPDSLVIVETTLPDSSRGPIRAALLEALQDRITARLLIRIDLMNQQTRLRLAPALECPPVVRSLADVGRYTAAMQTAGVPPGRAVLQFLVRPDGSLSALKVQTPSGNPDLDRVALSTVQLLRFTPEVINRIPVPGLVRFPVEVRVTRQAPPPPPLAAACPQGRIVEITNPLRTAVLVYAFSPAGAQLLGTAVADTTVRLALPQASAGYVFVQEADAAVSSVSDADLKRVRWRVQCGVP